MGPVALDFRGQLGGSAAYAGRRVMNDEKGSKRESDRAIERATKRPSERQSNECRAIERSRYRASDWPLDCNRSRLVSDPGYRFVPGFPVTPYCSRLPIFSWLPSDRVSDRASDRTRERSSVRASDRARDRTRERSSVRAIERSSERPSDRATERRATERPKMIITRAPDVHL